jgi:hypothetical protein
MMAKISLLKVAEGICHWAEREAENRSQDWPKFDGKALGIRVLEEGLDQASQESLTSPSMPTVAYAHAHASANSQVFP